ncbi:MAG: flagellar type III secretion system pore protein FliP [Candidatus Eremiobacterota bacterium]
MKLLTYFKKTSFPGLYFSRFIPAIFLILFIFVDNSFAASVPLPSIKIGIEKSDRPEDVSLSLQILIFMTVISLAPTILIMLTSFTRTVVVLSFTRNALGTQQTPSNQLIIGLSLFLTLFIMGPVFKKVNDVAVKPYMDKKISFQSAISKGSEPLREFMFKQTREEDLAVFIEAARLPRPDKLGDIPTDVLIPSFIISELRTAFQIGFLIYIPFLLIDVVVATTLMGMGMMMVPPMMISLPLKLMLFIMVDGWNLIVRAIVLSFN